MGCICIICIARKHLLRKLHRVIGTRRARNQSDCQASSEYQSTSQRDILRSYNKSQLQLVKVFGAIFTASLITVLPLVVLSITEPILGDNSIFPLQYLYPVAYISLMSKSVLHPMLEAYMTQETRAVVSRICLVFARGCTVCHSRRENRATSNAGAGTNNQMESLEVKVQ